ncbi:MAG TPA: alkaline phosphatase family protein [Candidatus Krumholzibacteria bacterium]|nr:alkaline phosphatase family protein [Candidatus Krumholzibacteria bacterium]
MMDLRRVFTLAGLCVALGAAGCGPGPEATELPERVLVVAVESLSPEQVDRMLADDRLPVLGRLIEQGARARLVAPDPLDPAMLWATAFTGKKAREHEMMGEFVTLPSGKRSLPPSSMRQSKTFLQIAGDAGLTVVGVGLPFSWPAEVHNGALVTPQVAPNRWTETAEHSFEAEPGVMSTYPPELYRDVAPLIRSIDDLPRETATSLFRLNESEYRMLYDEPLGSIYELENPLRDIGLTLQRDQSFVDVTAMLSEQYRPDVAALHLELLEPVQRVYWPFARPERYPTTPAESRRRFRDTVAAAYRRVDTQIGELLGTLPEGSTVCVVGQRGFGDGPDPRDPDGGRPVPQPTNETMMVLWGRGVERGVDLGRAQLIDVTPTLLRLMGVHLGSDMSGRVLRDALLDAFEQANPERTLASHDEDWDPSQRYPEAPGAPVQEGTSLPAPETPTPDEGKTP